MKIKEIYDLAVDLGKRYDVRGDYLNQLLQQEWNKYEKTTGEDREYYDRELLKNPFSDTRVLVGGNEDINTILCGIDMETPEILLADRLREKGQEIDMVLAHHPEGKAYAALYDVMKVQADMMEQAGVPINIAEGIMSSRISEVERMILPYNHQRAVDAARLLNIPFMCVHSPADNLVNRFLQNWFDNNLYSTLEDVVNLLHSLPEYDAARRMKAGPQIIVGEKNRRAGRIFIKMTGGTSGALKTYENLAAAGIGTVICMHMPEKHRQAAKDNHINVIIAGHMASDSLGMNLLLDELEVRGVKIIPCSGLIRVKRTREERAAYM
ncbi:NGG1p interacting factor NIF3 [Syntrophomonas erecta]